MSDLTISQKREIANEILSSKDGTISSKNEHLLDKINSTVLTIQDTVENDDFKNALNTTAETVDTVSTIFECAVESRIVLKEMDVILKQMDTSVEKYIHDANVSLEKFKTTAPILEKEIDKTSDRIDKILDKALSIDASECQEVDLELRTDLISHVKDWSDRISDLLMKLMGM